MTAPAAKKTSDPLKLCILDVDHFADGEKQLTRLWCKTRGGKTVVVLDESFKPYFYVEPKTDSVAKEIEDSIKKITVDGKKPETIEIEEKKIFGKARKLIKVVVPISTDVPKFRELVKEIGDVKNTYEYSISFYRRYLIDNGLVPMQWIEVTGKNVDKNQMGIIADSIIKIDSINPLPKERGYPQMDILAFDIEIIPEKGVDKIVMISMMDNRNFSRIITYGSRSRGNIISVKNEEELILKFIETIKERDPDFIIGYNSDGFDFQKLSERALENNAIPLTIGRDEKEIVFRRRERIMAARVSGRVHIDLYNFIRNILSTSMSTEALTLSKVAKELIGAIKGEMNWSELERDWRSKKIKKLADYCLKDSELALKLSEYLLPQIYELCKVVGQMPFDVSRMSYSQIVEWLLMRKAVEFNETVANRPRYDEIMRRRHAGAYVGGYVHEPKEGIHEKIALFDFASLYPSIIITHNISPETLDCGCCGNTIKNSVPPEAGYAGEKHYFCTKKLGFIPSVIKELVDRRRAIGRRMSRYDPKTITHRNLNNMQYALKILANASYGYYGYAGSRWYSRVCAESITAWGRFYIKKVIKMAQRKKLDVIYGDTDSLFLKVKNRNQVRDFREKVNKSMPGVMELEFENIYKSGIFVKTKIGTAAKKRYALIDYENKMTIRGFEKVRRDWSQIAKDTQEKVLLAVLRDRSPEKAVKIVRSSINDIRAKKINKDDLIIYTQLTKPLNQYEQMGPHVVAAKKYAAKGNTVKAGSTIAFIIIRGEGSISSRAEPAEYVEGQEYDPDYYINNQIIPAAMRVLSELNYTEDDLIKKKEQSSLAGFLKTGK